MDFLSWHYSLGIRFYLRRWRFYIAWVVHYFSLFLLVKSLFAPWKRLSIEEKVGFNFDKFFQKLTFNLISRTIGAVVRFFLLLGGLLVLLFSVVAGAVGLIFWLFLPFLSFPFYNQEKNYLTNIVGDLVVKIKANPQQAPHLIFANKAGAFILEHVGLKLADLINNLTLDTSSLERLTAQTYKDLVVWFINVYGLKEEFFRQKGFNSQDLIFAAGWWDQMRTREDKERSALGQFGRPGIGLELLFGYTAQLNKYVTDLGIAQAFSHHLIGREQIVSRIERALSSGDGVFVVGQPGVGKKTVILEFAQRARQGLLGPQMAYRRVLEFDYNALLSGATDLNQKKTIFATLLTEASQAGNVILVFRDIHRITNSEVEGYDYTDVFEQNMEKGDLKVMSILSSVDYERFVVPNTRLSRYFQPVEVISPTGEEALSIMVAAAEDLERQRKITILVSAMTRIMEGSERYITETPFPEKALELMDEVVVYGERKGIKVLTAAEVDAVLSEKTGISFAKLTESTKEKLGQLETIIHQRIVDQEVAVSLIARSLRASSVGVKAEERPIGSFLFLGPTGVGKTQTAKVLAEVYYGSEKNILRFDMAEYAGAEGLSRLIGSQAQGLPGVMTTQIKNRPASLLLLDEIEKSPREVMNLFLALLDEGAITDAMGRKISCRNLFVIATSNAGAEYIRELVNQGVTGEKLQKALLDYVQRQGLFAPEFLNRFDGVVVFEPIRMEDLPKISRLLLEELQENLKQKNIYLEITEEACQKVAQDGYEPAFGARPMRRVVELAIGDILGKAILKGEIKEGDKIKIVPGEGKEEYTFSKISN